MIMVTIVPLKKSTIKTKIKKYFKMKKIGQFGGLGMFGIFAIGFRAALSLGL
jgi:hypothetical protein